MDASNGTDEHGGRDARGSATPLAILLGLILGLLLLIL